MLPGLFKYSYLLKSPSTPLRVNYFFPELSKIRFIPLPAKISQARERTGRKILLGTPKGAYSSCSGRRGGGEASVFLFR